jgi:hypothetical protein
MNLPFSCGVPTVRRRQLVNKGSFERFLISIPWHSKYEYKWSAETSFVLKRIKFASVGNRFIWGNLLKKENNRLLSRSMVFILFSRLGASNNKVYATA